MSSIHGIDLTHESYDAHLDHSHHMVINLLSL